MCILCHQKPVRPLSLPEDFPSPVTEDTTLADQRYCKYMYIYVPQYVVVLPALAHLSSHVAS